MTDKKNPKVSEKKEKTEQKPTLQAPRPKNQGYDTSDVRPGSGGRGYETR